MIFGIGIDIIEVNRVKKLVEKDDHSLQKIFTPKEIAYCRKLPQGAESFAGRFAVKEAFLKAMGTGWSEGLKFSEIETLNDQRGNPEITLYGQTKEHFENQSLSLAHVSIAHLREYATAIVVLEK